MSGFFKGISPCKDCPYRIDAPLKKWHIDHFSDLLNNDTSMLGAVYSCHKKDGSVCRGWLMDQDKRYFPSNMLRLQLIKENVTRAYLDKLHCKTPLYNSLKDMCIANYPELAQD